MRFAADLHLHSRYSRATSGEADLRGYHRWARVKGIRVVGTGDFTHPRWLAELSEHLVERDGLYAMKEPPKGSPLEGAEPADTPVRFMLTAEISSIYKKHGQVRKVHSLIGVPTLEHARRLGARLAGIGNVASDGRPILGLDPKDLLSMLLSISEDAFLIPAHVWTPWFSLFGSRSGFDRIEDCFEELTPRIFALETGLSSDPPMNWRWSQLDRYRLVSNSDAHSPANLGREANLFDAEPSWRGIVEALRTGAGFLGTIEFFPEEGKYHFDGHRKCGVCMDPEQTRKAGGRCPVCGQPLTVGVLNRVLSLADRPAGVQPRPGEGFRYLIPLPELLAEITGSGAASKPVAALRARIVAAYGSEYGFLLDAPADDIARSQGPLLAEAVRRMREGRIDPRPGYDGEFGLIRVFDDAELAKLRGQDELFSSPTRTRKKTERVAAPARTSAAAEARTVLPEPPGALDRDQRQIVEKASGRSLVVAGPGTGKTRLLVGWIARVANAGLPSPGRILALTFTNRAAAELKSRIALLVPGRAGEVTAATFHSFAWSIIRERDPSLIMVFSPAYRRELLASLLPGTPASRLRELSEQMERCWEGMEKPGPELQATIDKYETALRGAGGVDISSLVGILAGLMRTDPELRRQLAERYKVIGVDEIQDINGPQYELLMLLCGSAEEVLCIGDPDQAIYGFRGSDRRLFFRFKEETGAALFGLSRSYRSSATIVAAADALITSARSPGIPRLSAVREQGPEIRVHPAADPEEEGRFIASAIRDLVGGVDSVSVDAARSRDNRAAAARFAFSDIAVLFRTRAVRDALLPGLKAAGLPLTAGENAPLAEEEPFRSLVAALRLLVYPADPVSLRILRAHGLAHDASGIAVETFLSRKEELLARSAASGIGSIIDEILSTIVNFDYSLPEVELGAETIRETAAEHGGDLPGFLAAFSLCARESEGPLAAQKVSLMTFHAAKGLEFPVVFIAGAEEGITPLADDVEEERRLFYVAITRAQDLLFLSHCGRRHVYGRERDCVPSRFLSDIPASLRREETQRPRDRQLTLF